VCYVLGGIVDRVHEPRIPKQASLLTAEEEGIPTRRLPLDKHIESVYRYPIVNAFYMSSVTQVEEGG
jgi:tRNA (Guanine-1)-methyltransferase